MSLATPDEVPIPGDADEAETVAVVLEASMDQFGDLLADEERVHVRRHIERLR